MFPSRSLFTLVALACSFVGVLGAIGPVADLHIVNAVVKPDGFERSAVLAGGTVEGPLIRGNKGDNFKLNVINELHDGTMLQSTSIHWHGFFQAGTNWADGPAFINQCPIAHGHSFLYDFHVPDQAGTFWYHSHLSTQYCDGLRGPFVVYDPNDPHASLYNVDDENTVITLGDWYHIAARGAGPVPTPAATLINGLGRYDGGPITQADAPLTIINVEAGKKYRFRLVNVACDPNYTFSVDGHSMTIIEVDGINHQPLVVDSIQIFAGQRYSFVIEANQPVANYWIRARPSAGNATFINGLNSAILRYAGAPEEDPTSSAGTSSSPLNEANLVPLDNPGAPGQPHAGGVDIPLNLGITFTGGRFQINGTSFTPPTVPVLLQILSGAQNANNLLPTGAVYNLPANAVVELSLPGGVIGGGHPVHLHGHAFDVIRSAGSSTYNYVNPPRRDVVNIGTTGDNVTIRWKTDNPGPWFLHCHIDWHLELGFAVVFAEDVPSWQSANPVPQAWSDLCPIYDALDPSEL